jgi:cytochrome c553
MKNILLGAVGILGLCLAVAAMLIQTGAPDFSADHPHSPVVHGLIEWARERSIAMHSAAIVAPADLTDYGRIRRGAGNYDAMCAECHLAPGSEDSEIRKGLYPVPPNLSKATADGVSAPPDKRRFWIVKHGIKGSGMPAWSNGGMDDEAIWDLTAFLKAMPSLSPEEYRRQVAASGGHTHAGMDGHDAEQTAPHNQEHSHDHNPHSHTDGDHVH